MDEYAFFWLNTYVSMHNIIWITILDTRHEEAVGGGILIKACMPQV